MEVLNDLLGYKNIKIYQNIYIRKIIDNIPNVTGIRSFIFLIISITIGPIQQNK